MNLSEKMERLNIRPINDIVYHETIKPMELRGADLSKYKYYKKIDNETMLYSESYLESLSYKELKSAQRRIKKIYLKAKIEGTILRLQLKWKQFVKKVIG